MAKMAKVPQTDWTRGGRDISNTSIPLYQQNLQRMGSYLDDPMAYQQKYLDTYFGADAVQNQDFLRRYNRAMGIATGNNYAATAGGLSSSAQRAYNDQQRYYNDLLSRMQGNNVINAYNMSNQDFQNMRGANADYLNAYNLGQNYSQIEQQNELAKQANKNWLGNAIQLGGTAIGSIWGPAGAAVGGALGGALGSAFQTDTSQAMAAIYGGQPANYANAGTGQFINPYQAIQDANWQQVGQSIKNWWNNRGKAPVPQSGSSYSGPEIFNGQVVTQPVIRR